MTCEWKVLEADSHRDRQLWIEIWSATEERDPFAHPDLCSLLRQVEGRLLAAVLEVDGGVVLYPFFLREIDERLVAEAGLTATTTGPLHDIVSPYGYGGPMLSGPIDVAEVTGWFWQRFDAWALRNSVVSEFVRLSLFGDSLLPYLGHTRKRQTNLVRDLDVDVDVLTQEVAPKVRSNVRRARREGVSTVIDVDGRHIEDFVRIYTETMERRESSAWYRFTRSFFEGIQAALPGQFAYVYAQLDGRLVSADLLLLGQTTGFYFLGGTEAAAFGVRPNDLVKMESMMWLKQHGRRRYVIGGGVTAEDSLERYKRGFAPRGQIDYLTGERIISQRNYDALVSAHRRRFGERGLEFDEAGDFFPAYRRDDDVLSRCAETADAGAPLGPQVQTQGTRI